MSEGSTSRAPASRRFTTAAVQMASGPAVQANLETAAALIAEAVRKEARLVALPENFPIMGYHDADKLRVAEPDQDGPIQAFLSDQARRHGIHLLGGTIPIRSVTDPERARAASPLYGPDGERLARYDKIHLFDVEVSQNEAYRESDTLEPGTEPCVVETELGVLGIAVCYDLRFPELFRGMVERGMEILLVPSAFTAITGEAHWQVLLRGRAIENLCYIVAPDQGGYHVNGRETFGGTTLIDPWGGVLGSLGRGSGVVAAEVDLARQQEIRTRFPALQHRRL